MGEFVKLLNQKKIKWAETLEDRKTVFDQSNKLIYELLIKGLRSGAYKNIVILTGAGISVSAGIPDFRSPECGIYSKLKEYNLPQPEDVFTLDYFKQHPEAFYRFSKEFNKAGGYEATPTHYFIRLLQEKGLLRINMTQNIDNLEEKAGINADLFCQAHGSYNAAHCCKCDKIMDLDTFKQHVNEGTIYRCSDESCLGPVKPTVVFFGEQLNPDFDIKLPLVHSADLLLVIGTSLAVQPFNLLPLLVDEQTHSVLINLESTKKASGGSIHDFESGDAKLFIQGKCDDVIRQIVADCGWEAEFDKILPEVHKRSGTARQEAEGFGAGQAQHQ
ncbi:hypothetical protein FGO68_gene10985 [Halteria grandinella]|uniref:Deacetylase sirtuin-type domain-containing protein n=1 Tax=Halteria grandinella TaxID=5974 RepID=A0A8J8NNT6_HALGN|nr:hypothetical protein FGO68_gene10985 [Halteria grandinella]